MNIYFPNLIFKELKIAWLINLYNLNVYRDDDMGSPKTPLTFRRMISREENVDVFSRLGAGTQDPTPGGKIRMCTEKVYLTKDYSANRHNIYSINCIALPQTKAGVPLQCAYIVEGHSSSVLSVQVADNILYTGAAGKLPNNLQIIIIK